MKVCWIGHDNFVRVVARRKCCKVIRKIDLGYGLSDVGYGDLIVRV